MYKEQINKYFQDLDGEIDNLNGQVTRSMNSNRKDFFDRFKGEMYNIHSNYRELKELENENLNKLKLKKDILDR
jgi:hypothetical protein